MSSKMGKLRRINFSHTKKLITTNEYTFCEPHLVLVKNIKNSRIEIYSQTDYEFKGHRHSYVVKYSSGTCASGGYGSNNEIIFPTVESALLDSIRYISSEEQEIKRIKREILLEDILHH